MENNQLQNKKRGNTKGFLKIAIWLLFSAFLLMNCYSAEDGTEFPVAEIVSDTNSLSLEEENISQENGQADALAHSIENVNDSTAPVIQSESPMDSEICQVPDTGLGTIIETISWSPDGKSIVFSLLSGFEQSGYFIIEVESLLKNNESVQVMELINKNEQAGAHAHWSPNGQYIISSLPSLDEQNSQQLYLLDTLTQVGQVIEPKFDAIISPLWSPDSKQVAFATFSKLIVFDIERMEWVTASDLKYWADHTWSPDSQQLVFSSNTNKRQLFLVTSSGTERRQLTNVSECARNPAWSPDGSKIAFESSQDFQRDLLTISPDGSNQRYLIQNNNFNFGLAWSPRGDQIAFVSHINDSIPGLPGDGSQDVYLLDLESNQIEQLTYSPKQFESRVVWSLDGSRIAFVVFDTESFNTSIDIFELNKKRQTTLVLFPSQ